MAIRELSSAPGTRALLARAALGALPGLSRRSRTLPDTELVLPAVRVDPDPLAAYAQVCGFGLRDELPLTYPHVLAFPLAMSVMADRSFPFPLVGMVHVANRITRWRPLRVSDRFDLRVRCADLRPHERGRQYDVIHEAAVDGEVVWREVSTYLRREASGGSARTPAAADPSRTPAAAGGSRTPAATDTSRTAEPSAVWQVPGDIGRRYAAVSGDHNPIHLHALAARPFGFPRAIAHGMWTMARCLAALDGRLPGACTVEVAFRLPLLLPAKVAFGAHEVGDGWHFWLRDLRTGRPHLAGSAEPVPPA